MNRTPEQIAAHVIRRYVVADPDVPLETAASWLNRDPATIIDVATIAAREAQTPPDFKPAGEFDYYRSQWERIDPSGAPKEDQGPTVYAVKVERRDSNGTANTNWENINADQARRILAMLSSEADQ